ncbi:hypothetical protein AAMO2058_001458300 [Amorphochlora amoebiformis]
MEPTEGNGSGAKAMVKQRSEGVAPTSASSATASAHAASQVRDAIRDEGLAAGAGAYSHRPGESKFHHRSMYGGGIALEKGSNSGRMSVPGPRERLERMEGLVPMERRMYMDRPGVVAQQYEDPRYMDEMRGMGSRTQFPTASGGMGQLSGAQGPGHGSILTAAAAAGSGGASRGVSRGHSGRDWLRKKAARDKKGGSCPGKEATFLGPFSASLQNLDFRPNKLETTLVGSDILIWIGLTLDKRLTRVSRSTVRCEGCLRLWHSGSSVGSRLTNWIFV